MARGQHRDDDFDVARIGAIARQVDETIRDFAQTKGSSPALRRAYEAYYRDLQALWEIVIMGAKSAGVPASELRAVAKRGGWTFESLRDALKVHAADRLADDAASMRRLKAKNRNAGARRAADVQKATKALDTAIRAETKAYRARHPYSREHSTRALAAHLSRILSRPPGTVRNRLTALGLR